MAAMGSPERNHPSRNAAASVALPLHLWGALTACVIMLVGWYWDISWHRGVGRDTVWTISHLAIYAALLIAFLYNAAMVLSHTFGRREGRAGIRVLGFRAPSGAFVTLWGISLQGAAILFDNWWHGVYGIDTAVFSPPHGLIAWGINFFYFGQLMHAARHHNATAAERKGRARLPVLVIAAILLGHLAMSADPSYGPMSVRSLAFVASSPSAFAFVLVLTESFVGWRWAGTTSAGLYMLAVIAMVQVFPLFPCTPRFGPVYHQPEHFLPPMFPLLLVVPAAVVGALWTWRGHRPGLGTSLLLGAGFVVPFHAVNWLWSAFLVSGWADNRFFGGGNPCAAFIKDCRHAAMVGWDVRSLLLLTAGWGMASLASWLASICGRWLRGLIR